MCCVESIADVEGDGGGGGVRWNASRSTRLEQGLFWRSKRDNFQASHILSRKNHCTFLHSPFIQHLYKASSTVFGCGSEIYFICKHTTLQLHDRVLASVSVEVSIEQEHVSAGGRRACLWNSLAIFFSRNKRLLEIWHEIF